MGTYVTGVLPPQEIREIRPFFGTVNHWVSLKKEGLR